MLYIRQIFTLFVRLYTSRIILNVLGVEDYGVYNVVGGIIVLFSFLNNTMTVATQRFLAYDIGNGNVEDLKKTFALTFWIHLGIGIIICILAETVGLFLLHHYINLPEGRLDAALWIFHLSVISLLIGVTQVPYSASITAHEKMDIFAYFSILDVALNLLIVFMLQWIPFDKLILYSILLFAVSILMMTINRIYCIRHFQECRIKWYWDKERFRNITSYAGWNMTNHFAYIARTQGVNIILNVFFGTALNAARGVALQVSNAINSFVTNFIQAMNPQIIKYYAQGELDTMQQLVIKGCKYSFFLLLILSMPIIIEAEYILTLWLKHPPTYSIIFCRLIMISALMDTLSGVVGYGALATGKIKIYQIVMSLVFISVPILTYIAYCIGLPSYSCIVAEMFSYAIALFMRPYLTSRITTFSISKYLHNNILPCMCVVIMTLPIPIVVHAYMPYGFIRLITVCIICVFSTCLSIWLVGIDTPERKIIVQYIQNKYRK